MFRLLRALAVIVPLGACASDTSTMSLNTRGNPNPAVRTQRVEFHKNCAAAAAAALSTPGHENRIYEITGPELIGSREIARILGELTGETIEVVEATSEDEGVTVPDMPAGTMLTGDFEELVGRPPMSVRQLLEANHEAWAGAR